MAFSFTQTSITARIVVVAVSNRDFDNGRCSSTVVLVWCRSGRVAKLKLIVTHLTPHEKTTAINYFFVHPDQHNGQNRGCGRFKS